jgi:hypothetical protein
MDAIVAYIIAVGHTAAHLTSLSLSLVSLELATATTTAAALS